MMTPTIHDGWVEFDTLATELLVSEHVCLRVTAIQGFAASIDQRYVRTSRDEYIVTAEDYVVLRVLLGAEPPVEHVKDTNRRGHVVDISRWGTLDD